MKLKDMDLSQLRKKADKLGVPYKTKTSEAKLRRRIKAKKAEMKAETAPAATWPAEWPEHMRAAYFAHIVNKPMPEDSAQAYAELMRAVDDKALDLQPINMATEQNPEFGYACLGLWYREDLKQCNTACPQMPLCKQVCATRPQLQLQVAQLEAAAHEVQAQAQAAPVAAEVPARAAKKPRARKQVAKAAQTQSCYRWIGDLTAYDMDGADEEAQATFASYQWMANRPKRKGGQFAKVDLIKQLGSIYEEASCAEVAEAMIAGLLDEGELEVVQEQLKSVAG